MVSSVATNTIQVMIYPYARLFKDLREWYGVLNEEEAERASRLKSDRLRDEFTAGRGFLRYLLSKRTGCRPAEIKFEYGAFQKPFLKNTPGLHFNVSHSNEYWAVALTWKGEVGFDIEFKNPNLDFIQLARTFCHPEELEFLKSGNGQNRMGRFYQLWSAKESVIKMDGRGLSMPVKELQLLPAPDSDMSCGPIKIRDTGHSGIINSRDLEIQTPAFDAGYSLAVCCSGPFETKIYFNKGVSARTL
jgi:4'-phosphopantetheinyl transferase